MKITYNKKLFIDKIEDDSKNFEMWINKPILDFFVFLLNNKYLDNDYKLFWSSSDNSRINEIQEFVASRKITDIATLGIPILDEDFSGYCFAFNPIYNIKSEDHYVHTWRISANTGYLNAAVFNNLKMSTKKINTFPQLLQLIAFNAFKEGYIVIQKLDKNCIKINYKERDVLCALIQKKIIYFSVIAAILNWDFSFLKYLFSKEKLVPTSIKNKYVDKLPDINTKSSFEYDVIIPTLGRGKYLKDVMDNFAAQSVPPQKIIIIEQIRNGKNDDDYSFLEKTNYPFTLIHKKPNRIGACFARNIAMDEVTSEYVFMADDDISFGKDLMKNSINQLLFYGADALNIGNYQPNEIVPSKKILGWEPFGTLSTIVKSRFILNIKFDLCLEFGYGEDIDFGIALRKEGAIILYSSYDSILHLKAPMGGFRSKITKPWDKGLAAKPSPTILYSYLKNYSKQQLKGYKIRYSLKRLLKGSIKNKILIPFQWRKSMRFAKSLINNKATINT